MFDDTVWEDSDLQGFRFNWDQSEKALDVTHFTPSWTNVNEAKLLEQEAVNADIERILCSVCHKVIESSVLYEKEVSFCSESCWQTVLYTAMDDFSLGGMSAWPLDTFGSYASKSFLLELATRSLDGTIIVKAVGAATELGDSASADLLALPLSETIRACSWMDKSLGPGSRANELRTHHNVSDDQFHWYIVEPLVMGSRWAEMDSALLEKKWLKRRVETRLPTDRLVLYLHALNAPPQIISTYLSHSENNEELIETATRLRMYSVAIQACVKRKDRVALQELLHRIPKKRPEHAEVVYYLSTPESACEQYLLQVDLMASPVSLQKEASTDVLLLGLSACIMVRSARVPKPSAHTKSVFTNISSIKDDHRCSSALLKEGQKHRNKTIASNITVNDRNDSVTGNDDD
ncbi:hypothetical protein CSKR_104072 [Clonorchis sinensis]|uniref:Uncharacterized protein n=1 Tax=Clonorchis sinensis TaxID=79923 RepID=A0A8T1MIC2_CLOSI|nr:hypothetical protein CSKR_104072 [Clonorchis sinensis]